MPEWENDSQSEERLRVLFLNAGIGPDRSFLARHAKQWVEADRRLEEVLNLMDEIKTFSKFFELDKND